MDSLSDSQTLLKKIYEFHRLTLNDTDDKIRSSMQEILQLWPDVIAAGNKANEEELFTLNVSRAILTQVFTIVLSKDFFNKDHSLIREIYFACFNILVNYVDIFQNNDSTFIDSNVRLLMKMMTSISSSVRFQSNDLSQRNEQQLLIAMREHLDQDSNHDNLSDGIISYIWNLSDITQLVPVLLKTGYASSVIQWIEDRTEKFREDRLNAPIHILHNLARHDDGIEQLNTFDAIKAIDQIYLENNFDDEGNDMTIHIAMIRALLSPIEQIKDDRSKYSRQTVNMLIELAVNAAKNDKFRAIGSHVSEPLTVVVKLFYNDQILDESLSNQDAESSINPQSFIDVFAALLVKFYPKIHSECELLEKYTCVVVFNLFWLISNHEKYRQLIAEQKSLLELIRSAATDEQQYRDIFMPRSMKSIQETAETILKNVNLEK